MPATIEERAGEIFARQTAAAVDFWLGQLRQEDRQAASRLDVERENLVRVLRYALDEPGVQAAAAAAALEASNLIEGRDYWADWLPILEATYDRLEEFAVEPAFKVRLLNRIGQIYRMGHKLERAEGFHRQALAAAAAAEEPHQVAFSHYNLGELFLAQHRYDLAERHAAAALAYFTTLPDGDRQLTLVLNTLGESARQRGRWSEASGYLRRAIEAAAREGLTLYEARWRSNLALCLAATGEVAQAQAELAAAEALLAETSFRFDRTTVQLNQGFLEAEKENWENAVRIFAAIDRTYLQRHGFYGRLAHVLSNLGYAQFRSGRLTQARQSLAASIDEWRRIGDELGLGNALADLAQVFLALEAPEAALPLLEEALEIVGRYPANSWAVRFLEENRPLYRQLRKRLAKTAA